MEFLEVDPDLLTAAGLADSQASDLDTENDAQLDAWIAELPTMEKAALLKRLLMGQGQQAERRLKSGFLAWQREQQLGVKSEQQQRTVTELRDLAMSAAKSRKQQEAAQRKKAETRRQAKRETYLRTLAADFDRHWRIADKRAEGGTASAYDEVLRAIVDLAEAYALCATRSDFDRDLRQFMSRHEKRGALVRRLVEAGLWKKATR